MMYVLVRSRCVVTDFIFWLLWFCNTVVLSRGGFRIWPHSCRQAGFFFRYSIVCRSMVHRLWTVAGQEGQQHGVVLPFLLYVVGFGANFALNACQGKRGRKEKRVSEEKRGRREERRFWATGRSRRPTMVVPCPRPETALLAPRAATCNLILLDLRPTDNNGFDILERLPGRSKLHAAPSISKISSRASYSRRWLPISHLHLEYYSPLPSPPALILSAHMKPSWLEADHLLKIKRTHLLQAQIGLH